MELKVKVMIWNWDETHDEEFNHKALVRHKRPLFMYWEVFVKTCVTPRVEDESMIFVYDSIIPYRLTLEIPVAPQNLLGVPQHQAKN